MGGDDTKTALLEAAKQLVGERGYQGASVRELAALAGTNLGAVNYHFGSRENLLNQAVLDEFLDWSGRALEVAVDPGAEPLQQFAARAHPMMDGLPGAQPAFIMFLETLLQARRSPDLHEQLVEHYAEQRRRAMDSISASDRGSRLPPRALEIVASYMIAVVDGFQLQALLDPDAVPTGEELAAFYEALAASARSAGTSAVSPENDSHEE
jgi:AcrR family transcriptional regulator